MRFWVPEEVDDSAVLKMCSGVRLWLGMGLSLWTEERMAVSMYQDGTWIGVWTRGLLGCMFQGKATQADTPLLVVPHPYLYSGYVTTSLHFTV